MAKTVLDINAVVGIELDTTSDQKLWLQVHRAVTPQEAGELACHLAAWAMSHGVSIDVLTEVGRSGRDTVMSHQGDPIMDTLNPYLASSLRPPVFVHEADLWLSSLTLFLATHHRSLSSITLSSLPSAMRGYLVSPTPTPTTPDDDPGIGLDLDHIAEVAEWCLTIVAWGCGIPLDRVSYSVRVLDRIAMALMMDCEIGTTLEGWRVSCEVFKALIAGRVVESI